jgi:hypothetical protein
MIIKQTVPFIWMRSVLGAMITGAVMRVLVSLRKCSDRLVVVIWLAIFGGMRNCFSSMTYLVLKWREGLYNFWVSKTPRWFIDQSYSLITWNFFPATCDQKSQTVLWWLWLNVCNFDNRKLCTSESTDPVFIYSLNLSEAVAVKSFVSSTTRPRNPAAPCTDALLVWPPGFQRRLNILPPTVSKSMRNYPSLLDPSLLLCINSDKIIQVSQFGMNVKGYH